MTAEWTALSRKRGPKDDPPPPYPPSRDPRAPHCKHGWNDGWGEVGEQQRRCRHCRRWIWDHSWERRSE